MLKHKNKRQNWYGLNSCLVQVTTLCLHLQPTCCQEMKSRNGQGDTEKTGCYMVRVSRRMGAVSYLFPHLLKWQPHFQIGRHFMDHHLTLKKAKTWSDNHKQKLLGLVFCWVFFSTSLILVAMCNKSLLHLYL